MQKTTPTTPSLFRRIVEFEAHNRVAVALALALLTFGLLARTLRLPVNLIVSWDAYAVSALVLAWLNMLFTDARTQVQKADLQDSSRAVIAGCVVLACIAGLFGACYLIASAKGMPPGRAGLHVALAAATCLASWLLVHTVLALHYGHVCYHLAAGWEGKKGEPPDLGVLFPNEPNPDFLDFAYFSFVIGMTFQVSDVQVTSRKVRRIVLLHSLLSFGYNTVIVALSINLAASLLN